MESCTQADVDMEDTALNFNTLRSSEWKRDPTDLDNSDIEMDESTSTVSQDTALNSRVKRENHLSHELDHLEEGDDAYIELEMGDTPWSPVLKVKKADLAQLPLETLQFLDLDIELGFGLDDGDTAAFDPQEICSDSEDDDDCGSVIYDKEVMEIINEEAVNDETVAEEAVTVEAHPEETDPFHRFVPSLDEEDDTEEDEDTLVARCDERIRKVVHFFHEKSKTVCWKSVKAKRTWMNFAFLQPLKKSDPVVVTQIFLNLIPRNIRAVLGHRVLRREDLMSLPQVKIDNESKANMEKEPKAKEQEEHGKPQDQKKPEKKDRDKVVYLLFGEDESEGHANDAIYPGSSTLDGDDRMGTHSKVISDPSKIARDTKKRRSTLFCHRFIVRHKLKPRFIKVATFAEVMPEYGLTRTNRGWLVRLLEEVMMLLTDSYMTPPAAVERLRWGVTRDEYLEALAACGIARSPFFPLNRALPLKQGINDGSDKKQCRICKVKKSRNWFFDFVLQAVLATIFLCEACWVYAFYHEGKDRPQHLWGRKAPISGPCDNCGIEETARWHWHSLDKSRKHCQACYQWFRNKGFERPQEVYKKYETVRVCAGCKRTDLDVGGVWQPVRDKAGDTTGAHRCPACAVALKRQENALALKNNNYCCYFCKTTDLSVEWQTLRCCKGCWNHMQRNDEIKKLRDRRECWNCRVSFEPARPGQKSPNIRDWCETLSQWLCASCTGCLKDHQCLRLTSLHLRGFEIRCEFCETLYCPRWVMYYTHSEDPKALVNIICANCKNHINRGKTQEELRGTRRDHESGVKDRTFQQWREGKKKLHNSLEITLYLHRHHAIDFTVEGVLQVITDFWQRLGQDFDRYNPDLLNMINELGIATYPGIESMDWD